VVLPSEIPNIEGKHQFGVVNVIETNPSGALLDTEPQNYRRAGVKPLIGKDSGVLDVKLGLVLLLRNLVGLTADRFRNRSFW